MFSLRGRVFQRLKQFSKVPENVRSRIIDIGFAVINARIQLVQSRRCKRLCQTECLIACELVSWIIDQGYVQSRMECVAICQQLVNAGFLYEFQLSDGIFQDDDSFWKLVSDIPPNYVSIWSIASRCSKAGFLTIPGGMFWAPWSQYFAVVPSQHTLFQFDDDLGSRCISTFDLTRYTVCFGKTIPHSIALEDVESQDFKLFQASNRNEQQQWIRALVSSGAVYVHELSASALNSAALYYEQNTIGNGERFCNEMSSLSTVVKSQ